MMNAHLYRQIDHWRAATQRLRALDTIAAPAAWTQLERYTDTALRSRLNASISSLQATADLLIQRARRTGEDPDQLHKDLQALRKQYLRTEVTLDYFGDAINTRTDERLGRHLIALDRIAGRAMEQALQPLGHLVPPVMSYLDKGLGASILKAGLRLWDQRGVNPVAVIKVVRHNVYRPTALIHEAGHQIAYILNWNRELADRLRTGLANYGPRTTTVWSSWSSEIAADAFAFVFTGYAAVATLQDVLSGSPGLVFQFHAGDPHPIPFLRTLLGVAMCREVFGAGPWDDLERHWLATYPLSKAPPRMREWLDTQRPIVSAVVKIVLHQPMQAFGGRTLLQHLPMAELHPSRLLQWGATLGPATAWDQETIERDTLRLLSLSVYQQATESYQNDHFRREMDHWFARLASRRMNTQNQFA